MFYKLEYKASHISAYKIYIARQSDIVRFFQEIKSMNKKHLERFNNFKK